MDIFVQMDEFDDGAKADISSKQMFELVLKAFKMQKSRKQGDFNARLNEKEIKNITIEDDALALLAQGVARFGLSERGRVKSLKVARTIADLDESQSIQKNHILEALSYRKR